MSCICKNRKVANLGIAIIDLPSQSSCAYSLVNLRSSTGEERRRQTLSDKHDNNLFEKKFRRTSPSFKQIFS